MTHEELVAWQQAPITQALASAYREAKDMVVSRESSPFDTEPQDYWRLKVKQQIELIYIEKVIQALSDPDALADILEVEDES